VTRENRDLIRPQKKWDRAGRPALVVSHAHDVAPAPIATPVTGIDANGHRADV